MASRVFRALLLSAAFVIGQSTPAKYEAVLKSLGKQGDLNMNVLKINIINHDAWNAIIARLQSLVATLATGGRND